MQFLMALLGLVLISCQALAFEFTEDFEAGIYWQSFPISMNIFVDTTAQGLMLDEILNEAGEQWENIAGIDIWETEEGHKLSNSYFGNYIRWSNDFSEETGYNSATTLAVTVRHRVGTYFSQIEIILNAENEDLKANRNNILYQTILHELGHVVGIDHSEYNSAVMYPSLQGIDYLADDDQEAVIALIDETMERQEVGFVSELASSNSYNAGNVLACGSVSLASSEDDEGEGPGNGAATVVLGFMLVILFQKRAIIKD